jgi:alginate O-acetyltransferase complex protein AlgI
LVFSSLIFLFLFLPFSLTAYYFTPNRFKNLLLLILSLLFYSWGEVKYFPIMLSSILVDYFASNNIEKHRSKKHKKKLWLMISIVFNLGMLFFFKYTDFLILNINAIFNAKIPYMSITLPLGISFYTFQTMSYTIDVYRDNVKPEKNIIDFGTFVVLFPQLIAGPIVRYTQINKELKARTVDAAGFANGMKIFTLGLASKVLIANNVGELWSQAEVIGFNQLSSPLAWLALLAFTMQIYFDFSGYSLMAIGLGRILGFEFPKNFDFPYISKSITEFWRRWHMTLGSWFREYLYFPLGGSRKGRGRTYYNLLVVWAVTGLWHGASWNFVLWGLYFCLLLIIEKAFLYPLLQNGRVWPHLYTLIAVMISWAIFAVTNYNDMIVFMKTLFSFSAGNDWQYYLRNYIGILFIGFVFSTPVLKPLLKIIDRNNLASTFLYASIFLLSTAYLVDSTYNPFLYFRF